jgi:F-type H+-transporting ATPase subunit delta
MRASHGGPFPLAQGEIAAFRLSIVVASLEALCYRGAAAGGGPVRTLACAQAFSSNFKRLSRLPAAKMRDCSEREIVTATDQTVSGVAGRYASALFDLAQDENAVEPTQAALNDFQALLDESEDLRRLVRSPVFSAEDQIAALDAVAARAGIGGLALNFIRLAAKNRRLFVISDMIRGFGMLVATAKGEVRAEVTSADRLSEAHIDELKAALKASIGRDVQLATKVDAAILGGLIVKVGSRMIDNSLKTKLDTLKIAMKGTA